MNTKTTLPISEARKKIFEIAKEVQRPNNYYVFTEKGRPKAVMMSAADFESWVETLEVMREFPNLQEDIERIDRDIESGKYKTYATLEEILAREGYVLADKAGKSYAVSNKIRKKGGKRARKNS